MQRITCPRQSWHSSQVLPNIKAQQFHLAAYTKDWFVLKSSNVVSLTPRGFSPFSHFSLLFREGFVCFYLMNTEENRARRIYCQSLYYRRENSVLRSQVLGFGCCLWLVHEGNRLAHHYGNEQGLLPRTGIIFVLNCY